MNATKATYPLGALLNRRKEKERKKKGHSNTYIYYVLPISPSSAHTHAPLAVVFFFGSLFIFNFFPVMNLS